MYPYQYFAQALETAKEFSGLAERAADVKQRYLERKLKQKQREDEQSHLQSAEQEKTKRRAENLLRNARDNLSSNKLTWEEITRAEDAKRDDRLRRRKDELARSAAYPGSLGASVEAWKAKLVDQPPVQVAGFKAESPEEVTNRLARQKALWDSKLAKTKERLSASQSMTGGTDKAVESMLKRDADMKKKKQDIEAERASKKAEEARKEREAVEIKKRKLLETKLPDARLTKSAETRAKTVKLNTNIKNK